MQAHTNAPPTDPVILSFAVPPEMVNTVLQTMHSYGLREENESVPWREALQVTDAELPAMCLRGARYREALTQKQLSELTGIAIPHISAMENGKRPIGKVNAKKLAEALNTDYKMFL